MNFDGGSTPADLIGTMKRFIPITIGPNPLALPPAPADATVGKINAAHNDKVLQIGGGIFELGRPTLGMAVQKRGRTSFLTTNGVIVSVNATIDVNYGGFLSNRFGLIGNAFMVQSTDGNPFATFGDSGSVVFSQLPGSVGRWRTCIVTT